MNPIYIEESAKQIPFIRVLTPYVEKFLNINAFKLSTSSRNNFLGKILEELSTDAELILQSELDHFVKNTDASFDEFVCRSNETLSRNFPVLHERLKAKVINSSKYINKIFEHFQNDFERIIATFNFEIDDPDLTIVEINTNLGDGHNGEGTALIHLSNGKKLIYKPRSVEISNSYHIFINWVNSSSDVHLKTFKVVSCENYGWLEFVEYNEVNSDEELQEYYYQAGMLLAITFILGSKDYHRENIIASGKNPVLIDHETIIQPLYNNSSVRSWDEEHKIPHFSVLESALIINPSTGVPPDCAGYGVTGQLEVTEIHRKVVNPNTLHSKRASRFITRKLVGKNMPVYKGSYVFADQHKDHFKNGFSAAYDLFLKSKEELKSDSSPFRLFKNKEVRYVWRPTFVYFNILKYLRNPIFMQSSEVYYSKLYDLLSIAYKGENMDEYKFILDFEMDQMLKGDIPIFSLQSTDNYLDGNTSFNIFEKNCIENIYERVDLLSKKHKQEQLKYIDIWLNIK